VRVTPGARETDLSGWREGVLRLKVREPAEKGRANNAAARLLADRLGVPVGNITLKHGGASREKLFEIAGLTDDEVQRRLGAPLL
jgi:uncharacterized protein YggU (UPF0235/DUF167 family)